MSDLFKDSRTDWLRSVRANYTPQRIDTTSETGNYKDVGYEVKRDTITGHLTFADSERVDTTSKNAGDFQRGCQHVEWLPIGRGIDLEKCAKCYKVKCVEPLVNK